MGGVRLSPKPIIPELKGFFDDSFFVGLAQPFEALVKVFVCCRRVRPSSSKTASPEGGSSRARRARKARRSMLGRWET
eukprot:SAG11_NODE_1615_length_4578_cov_6.001786_9_plen_78_part_00